jgi:hypothetical protein
MIRAVLCDTAEALQLLAPSKSSKTDPDNLFDLADMIAQGTPYKVVDQDGKAVAAYVLQPRGPVLWMLAVAGRAPFDLVRVIGALVQGQGREFDSIGFRTERPGLARKAQRIGYKVTRREGRAYYLSRTIE